MRKNKFPIFRLHANTFLAFGYSKYCVKHTNQNTEWFMVQQKEWERKNVSEKKI